MGRRFGEDCDDIVARLSGIIGSYASTLYEQGLSISSIRDRIAACADMFVELGAAYIVSMSNYESYYQELSKHLGCSARYQLLGNLFAGTVIKGMESSIPAIRGKMGNHEYYSFSIEPEKLLKRW